MRRALEDDRERSIAGGRLQGGRSGCLLCALERNAPYRHVEHATIEEPCAENNQHFDRHIPVADKPDFWTKVRAAK